MVKLTYYEVRDFNDNFLANCSTEELGLKFAKCLDGEKVYTRKIVIFDSVTELHDYKIEEEKKIALSKLTDREKILLGLPNA